MPLLLFYPTSPVHVRDLQAVRTRLSGWRCQAIVYEPLSLVAPGISAALKDEGIEAISFNHDFDLDSGLPRDAAVLLLGAVFEPFALDLFAWTKLRRIPVVAIQEVAQLALNQFDINNYDAPFDRLFVASAEEFQGFIALGYPSQMLRLSGLLAFDRLSANSPGDGDAALMRLGIIDGRKPIVYTTSPLRGRLALHNKDDLAFREAALKQIGVASRQTARRAVIKLHPNENLKAARGPIRKIIPDAIVIGREFRMDELFAATGILVNRGNSQTCLESVLRGVPTVVVACGLETLFHNAGGAYVVETLDGMADAIVRASTEGAADISDVKVRHFFLPAEGVAGFIANELSELIASPPACDDTAWNWLIRSVLFIGGHDRAFRLIEHLAHHTAWHKAVGAALKAHLEGRRNEAIERWQECIAHDQRWYFPHYELAHAYLAAGEYRLAVFHANRAIELHPPFHGLWHELPMRVVLMASLRKMGNPDEAGAELRRLEERSLVDIVPELLIEKSEQLIGQRDKWRAAYDCLEHALRQLEDYPVNGTFDAEIRGRAHSQVRKLAEHCESEKEYLVAKHCYAQILNIDPDDVITQFALARLILAQGSLFTAIKILVGITGIPEGPRKVVENALPSSTAAVLAPFWPGTPGSILRQFKLVAHTTIWATDTLLRTKFRDWSNPTMITLLVAMFVLRHFAHRLIA